MKYAYFKILLITILFVSCSSDENAVDVMMSEEIESGEESSDDGENSSRFITSIDVSEEITGSSSPLLSSRIYDDLGRIVEDKFLINDTGIDIMWEGNRFVRVESTRTTIAMERVESFGYDSTGRIVNYEKVDREDNLLSSLDIEYNNFQANSSWTSSNGVVNEVLITLDTHGNVLRVELSNGGTHEYDYNSDGDIAKYRAIEVLGRTFEVTLSYLDEDNGFREGVIQSDLVIDRSNLIIGNRSQGLVIPVLSLLGFSNKALLGTTCVDSDGNGCGETILSYEYNGDSKLNFVEYVNVGSGNTTTYNINY